MKYCHICGAELEDDAVFCNKCGAELKSVIFDVSTPKQELVTNEQPKEKEEISIGAKAADIVGLIAMIKAIVFSCTSYAITLGLEVIIVYLVASLLCLTAGIVEIYYGKNRARAIVTTVIASLLFTLVVVVLIFQMIVR